MGPHHPEADAAVLTAPGRLEIHRRPVPAPGPGEILIRVAECGICGSDHKIYRGQHPVIRPPAVLGHEIYGHVAAVGDPAGTGEIGPGEPVTVVPPIGCGRCYLCRRGEENLCAGMQFVGGQRPGGLAQYVLAPARNVLRVDPRIPEPLRVLIEPVAVAVHTVHRGQVAREDRCLVLGAGPIGVLTALVLRARGVDHVHVADPVPARLEQARRLGCGPVCDMGAEDVRTYVSRAVRPEGADVVVECAGTAEAATAAWQCARRGGRVVLAGVHAHDITVPGLELQRAERTLIGVQMYTRSDFAEAMELLARGGIPAEVVGARYPLSRVQEAFARSLSGGSVLKVAVQPQS